MEDEVIYEGDKFTLYWSLDKKGKCQAKEYFDDLTVKRQDKALALFSLMGDLGKIRNETKFRSEGDGIFVFKPQPDRFFCFFMKGSKIYVTNAYEKKSQKMPKAQKTRALRLRGEKL